MTGWCRLFISVLLFGLLSQPVSAAILFAGGEDIDFTLHGSIGNNTNTGSFRAAYARTSLNVQPASGDPGATRITTPVFTASSTVWIHAQYCEVQNSTSCSASFNTTTANVQMIRIIDDAGNPTLVVRGTGTDGQLKISSRTAGGVFTDLVTCSNAIDISVLDQLDLLVNYSAVGQVTLYKNSAQVCSFSGDVTNGDGATTINQIDFAGPLTTGPSNWSEVIVADSDTRAMSLVTMEPGSAGNSTAWTGANPCTAIVNVIANNDASFISTASNNLLNQCAPKFGNGNAGFPAGTFVVNAVVTSFRALRGATGPQHIQHNLRTGGVDSNSSDETITTSFSNFFHLWATNPNGGGAWATSDLTSGFNLGVKSTP